MSTMYFTKACQLYRDRLKQMATLNEVFIISKDLHNTLPISEGKISIFGVSPSYMFNQSQNANIESSSVGGGP
jgi:hypothetical protein